MDYGKTDRRYYQKRNHHRSDMFSMKKTEEQERRKHHIQGVDTSIITGSESMERQRENWY